jgi:small subunit ribosomal protein S20
MANIKSAKKRVLTSAKRAVRNKAGKTAVKTAVKKARLEIADGSAAGVEVKAAIVKLDKAVTKGFIHKNKAARLKSRLSKAAKPQV